MEQGLPHLFSSGSIEISLLNLNLKEGLALFKVRSIRVVFINEETVEMAQHMGLQRNRQ